MAEVNHGELVQNLYDKIVAVPAFEEITGVVLGAMEPDPTLIKLTPPACWVSFVGDASKETENQRSVPTQEVMTFMFMAFIYLPMASQARMIADYFPLLSSIVRGVRGAEANTGHRWAYKGQKLVLINADRFVYGQRYTITGTM